ncbi:hypothetical protein LSCM1_05674 [Leishmania martiniquensis]|uniref:Uncharacterized protein n=1 Tax=Leishmania martiniquensis TaxID=1580590 RepID=A0A836GH51_9TRYP|nr:hypothetical protein LSCM1_05674 [Leishmania martiniquensis]
MASQKFFFFLLRRIRCAAILFVSLLMALYAITSAYYVVRIGVIEKSGAFGQSGSETDVEGVTRQLITRAVPLGASRIADGSTAKGPAAPLRNMSPRSSGRRGAVTYKVLRPGAPRVKQHVRNPTLPEDVPLWDDNSEHASAERDGSTREAIPSVQRFALAGLKAGSHYLIRLSFLGSPSVGFEMRLYQVRRSTVEESLKSSAHAAGRPLETAYQWTDQPQDTELLVFTTSCDNELAFSTEEGVWVDREDMDSAAGEHEFGGAARRHVVHASSDPNDPFLPVIEVRPRAYSIPLDAYRVRMVSFNIELEPLSTSFLPQMAVPLMIYFVWALIFVGYAGIYTLVSSGIASGVVF